MIVFPSCKTYFGRVKKQHIQIKRGACRAAVGILSAICLLLAGCAKSYQLSEDIVGTWKVTQIMTDDDETHETAVYEPEGLIEFTFNEDGTYTAKNEVGMLENTEASNPFRAKGNYKGQYLVDAPTGVTIREEYRAHVSFAPAKVEDNVLSIRYTSYHDHQFVTITLNH
jgi:Domain of unknown function (DUF5004)